MKSKARGEGREPSKPDGSERQEQRERLAKRGTKAMEFSESVTNESYALNQVRGCTGQV